MIFWEGFMSVRKVGEAGFSDFLVCQRAGLNEVLDHIKNVIDWGCVE